ncbi:ABC transporter substrate-binding protein [Paenibacillus sp. IHBB 10380]|uniref:ABC transporter substrate-binding protein n=1 Tax=Paenibacillus sp. IHBB 10380 TaxID=1566358 RepID=UPI0005CFC060|nr:extracellular solute-binding protein [Paenibacillus sp. IHBB 10380]AJS59792.1 ABC transporter substrate-binding protein [Paenibacillus sp. IHBB 10380]
MKKWLGMICIGILMTTTTACGSGGSKELASKEKPVIKEGKTIVTLSIQQPSEFIQIAEKKFEEKYPEIDLQIQTTEDYETYTKTTNTALLSGKGPDIFGISGLPIDDYLSKKLLLNMDDSMEQDKTLNKSDLKMNVLELLKVNGGMYAMPLGFGMSVFVGDGNAIKNSTVKIDDKSWNWSTFEEISKELIQQAEKGGKKQFYALANYPADSILTKMVSDNYAEFVDLTAKKAKFDSPEFVELMQNIKKMFDEKVMTEQLGKTDNQLFSHANLTSVDFIGGLYLYSHFENPVLLQQPHIGKSEGTPIHPLSQIAIRANSPVKDEAWKFISFLLSDEAQSLQAREGFSLLASVNDKKLNEIQEQVKSGTYKFLDGKKPKVSDEEFMQFKHLVNGTYRYEDADVKVFNMIYEDSVFFFSGQKSAEEVAKLIQNKVTIYLNE